MNDAFNIMLKILTSDDKFKIETAISVIRLRSTGFMKMQELIMTTAVASNKLIMLLTKTMTKE